MTKLLAGVGKSDISPLDKSRLNDPMYARVLFLVQGDVKLAIIAMDAVAIGGIGDIPDSFMPELRKMLSCKLGISELLVNASHTHTAGPMLCPYEEQLAGVCKACEEAAEHLCEVKMGIGLGEESRFMVNRSLKLRNGKLWTIRQCNPCPPDEMIEGFGPMDPEIGVLRFDKLDGTPLAILFNYAGHPLIGAGGKVTANYPGFACHAIDEATGAMSMFIQGAGGDMSEVGYKDVFGPISSENNGRLLAESTLQAWRKIVTNGEPVLKTVRRVVRFPRRNDVPERVAQLRQEEEGLLRSLRFTSLNFRTFIPLYLKYKLDSEHPLDYSYKYIHDPSLELRDKSNRHDLDKYEANIHAMERMARIEDRIATYLRHKAINDESGEETIEAEIVGIRLGGCVIVSTPVEALAEVGLRLKEKSPVKPTFLSAYSNGYMHYGPPAEYYDLESYEVTECFLGPGWHKVFEDTALEIIQELTGG